MWGKRRTPWTFCSKQTNYSQGVDLYPCLIWQHAWYCLPLLCSVVLGTVDTIDGIHQSFNLLSFVCGLGMGSGTGGGEFWHFLWGNSFVHTHACSIMLFLWHHHMVMKLAEISFHRFLPHPFLIFPLHACSADMVSVSSLFKCTCFRERENVWNGMLSTRGVGCYFSFSP